MNLKTFTARTMAEALAQVRKQVGQDAVILHTRTYQQGGILGFGARHRVEVTAVDGREYAQQRGQPGRRSGGRTRQSNARAASRTGRDRAPAQSAQATSDTSAAGDSDSTAGDLIRRTYAAARAELEQNQPAPSHAAPAPAAPSDAARASQPVAAASEVESAAAPQASANSAQANQNAEQLADEMRSMRRMVARMMSQQQRANPMEGEKPDKLFDQYMALLEQEVTEELAGEVVQQVRQNLDAEQLDDEQACRGAVMQAVAGLLPHRGESNGDDSVAQAEAAADNGEQAASPAEADGRPRTIALVGPTGVGKTTTIAKLAATFKLKQNKQVGLITMDTYRIAAVDQLRTYAGIIGVDLHVTTSPAEMREAVHQCRGCDVVLIDTAGRSQRDDPRLEELRSFLEAAAPHETHLVLSSTCTERVLEDTIERFSKIQTDRIIFTKLDEAVTFGVVLNVLRKVKKRLSYITTGQEVPHQIEPARPDRLAALMLGEEPVSQ